MAYVDLNGHIIKDGDILRQQELENSTLADIVVVCDGDFFVTERQYFPNGTYKNMRQLVPLHCRLPNEYNRTILIDARVENYLELPKTFDSVEDEAWLTREDFESLNIKGYCWIKFNGDVSNAYYDIDQKVFRFNISTSHIYMSECISYVQPIPSPD